MTELEKLFKNKEALEAQLLNERMNLNDVALNVGWSAGMKRTGTKPFFRFEKELDSKIKLVEDQIQRLRGLIR